MGTAGIDGGFRALLGRLVTFKVNWHPERDEHGYVPGDDRVTAPLADANVVSSLLTEHEPSGVAKALDFLDDLLGSSRHVIALDIDHPAWLIESSTKGHHHLYIDVPGGVEHEDYMALLELLGKIGVIEPGYVEASKARGSTFLRLPWVGKHEGDAPMEPDAGPPMLCCRCRKTPAETGEYDQDALEAGMSVADFAWENEGTLNRKSGLFACTTCYIALGRPTSAHGWKPRGFANPEETA